MALQCREFRRYDITDALNAFSQGVKQIGLPLEKSCWCQNPYSLCLSEKVGIPSWAVIVGSGLLGVLIDYNLTPKEKVCSA